MDNLEVECTGLNMELQKPLPRSLVFKLEIYGTKKPRISPGLAAIQSVVKH
jgi:hypothetical protein